MTLAPAPGPHGGDGPRLARALGVAPGEILDLSASLNPVAPDAAAIVARHLDAVGRYPDPTDATRLLAGALGVDPGRVLLTNGGSEAIALVAGELGEGWIDRPDFGLYERHLSSIRPGAPRWRSNPHNPTGRLAGPTERAAVWDEAFYPLATGHWTSGVDAEALVLGSLTKLFACPGLRLGFVLGDPDTIVRLAAHQPRWSVNGVALESVADFLAVADLTRWASEVASLRDDLVTVLRRHGLAPLDSAANFVLVASAGGLRERLARSGILVRDCASFGLADHVRIAVPSSRGLDRLASALPGAVERPGPEPSARRR